MTEKIGKYIYGIVNSTPHPAPMKKFSVENGWRVYTIPYQDISAVVSDSEIVAYTHMPKDALARLLVKHQKIIERIMSSGCTVIPMRLGTFAADETGVKNILDKGYKLIKRIGDRIRDKIEIELVVTWSDFNSVLKEVGEDEEIREFKEKLLANPKGATVDEQMKIGVMVKKALDKKREKCALEIQTYLRGYCEDFKLHELMDDKMIINTGFLINKRKQEDFERKIEELNIGFNERLNFRCVGPLPPYSFYTLEIKKAQFEEIDWARKKLGLLNNFTSEDEVKEAYRTRALSSHPDRNLDTPGVEKEFDDVTRAYKLLVDYCQVCEQAGQKRCSFEEEEFKKNAILVTIRG